VARIANPITRLATPYSWICAAAGILAGSMYHHFRSKEDLYVSAHAEGERSGPAF
jgi:hypothetical protein